MHLGPDTADLTKFQHPRLLGEHEHLHEEVLEFLQKGMPKRCECIVVGMEIACDEAKGHRFIGRSLNLTGTEDSYGIAIQKQAQQHFGCIGFSTALPIVSIQS